MEQLQLVNYVKILRERVKESELKGDPARNHLEEIMLPYFPEYNWENPTFFQDMQAFWVNVRKFLKTHTEAELTKLLEWSKGKNLHPKQMCKALCQQQKQTNFFQNS